MYIGALMPPSPIKPIKSPCPIHKGQGGPSVEIVRPIPIMRAPKMTVQRVPTLSASRPIRMPPTPEPNQASALASAGIERVPSTSAAMSFRATAVIHAAPNAISMVTSAAVATAHDFLDSTEDTVGCNIRRGVRLINVVAGRRRFDHPHRRGAALPAALRQNARGAYLWKFPFRDYRNFEIDPTFAKYSLHRGFSALRRPGQPYMRGASASHCRLYKAFHAASNGQPRRQVRPQPVACLRDRFSGVDPRLPDAEGARPPRWSEHGRLRHRLSWLSAWRSRPAVHAGRTPTRGCRREVPTWPQ